MNSVVLYLNSQLNPGFHQIYSIPFQNQNKLKRNQIRYFQKYQGFLDPSNHSNI